jgi:hypothetical protein
MRIGKVTAPVPATGLTAVRISGTAEKTFAVAAKASVIVGRIIRTAEATETTAGKNIRTAGGTGVPAKGISRTTGDIRAITREISGTTGDIGLTTAEISGSTGDYDVITKGISEPNVAFAKTTNAIIPQGQIAGTDDLLNVTGLYNPADPTEGKAGAKLSDVRYGIKLVPGYLERTSVFDFVGAAFQPRLS